MLLSSFSTLQVYNGVNTGSNSFESIGKWIDFVRESRGSDTLIFVVGNKLDLEADRNVKTEKAEAQVKAQGINYY
jgi:GTPase SAR1 family protein